MITHESELIKEMSALQLEVRRFGKTSFVHQMIVKSTFTNIIIEAYKSSCEYQKLIEQVQASGVIRNKLHLWVPGVPELNSISEVDRLDLQVDRCVLIQPKLNDNWTHPTIPHALIEIRKLDIKALINSNSCVNIVSLTIMTELNLTIILRPSPYKIPLINSSDLEAKERSLVPIQWVDYKNKI